MQTIPIANPANLISSAPPANKQAEGNAPATSFNQVLSREVAGRSKTDAKASESRRADASPARPTTEVQAKPVQSKSNETKSDGTKAADKKQATDETDDTAAADTVAADTAAATTPSDMLALVASLNPVRPRADVPAGKKESKDAVDVVKPGANADALAATAAGAAAVAVTTAGDKTAIPADKATKVMTSGDSKLAAADGKPALAAERRTARASDTEQALADDQSAASGGKPAVEDLSAKPAHEGAVKLADAAPQKNDFAAEVKDALAAVQATTTPQVPQAALHAANAAAAHLTDRLAPQVGTPGWDKALGQKITWMVAGEQQTASLTLNPPDLGPLQVVLSVSNSQANAAFTAAQPEVRQAIEAAMPKLREMLSDAGIQLGQATVSSGSANQQHAQDQKQFQPGMARPGADDGRAEPAVRVGRVQPAAPSGRGLVDTFV